ncbi:murein biosynthesis integral membrane protein MurJ [Bifidobacterium sp. UBA4282]|uniref:murein biosynthesis integral membrane protein MurJ n=1 Tax=Bifidobacterium sp. UBA4282 TaxID=1946096 RepID=UPI0025C62C9A|nr:murein biosynthesis integral membrane protein MurJ [Bifidobacterium sp. UBA4282]
MSSSIGRNSLIMASGTAASRVTGQIRTILLAAAMGTTGMAANAYQAGAMIPQVMFTLVSGGIFNAVLVPQIVRTLNSKDAEERLDKLITVAIALLLAVTALMAAATPLLTTLYVNGSPELTALTNAFTLWCMPQIFFYGLYTVIGQILAAKDHFGTYAWSSVGANVISCIGFTVFILLFGGADQQSVEFWTADKLALTAGAWTAGVAFQALILFVPMARIGIRYRPRWGLRGIGLRSMGPVAAWSVGVVVINQLANIINTRITTNAPETAEMRLGISQFDVAGNATYQNAYTLFMLPYSLIAVSVATAMFPQISRALADHDLDDARRQLSSALRNVGVLMFFFAAAFVVIPAPITLALLPSVSVDEALLIAGPLVGLGIGLPMTSAYLIIQRTFFAFEDGKHPFIFAFAASGVQVVTVVAATFLLPPQYWVTALGASVSVGNILCFPLLLWMLRRRFGNRIDGMRLARSYGKAIAAAVAAAAVGIVLLDPVYALVGADFGADAVNWLQAVGICVISTIVITVVYVGALWLMRSDELLAAIGMVRSRLGGRAARDAATVTAKGQTPRDTPDSSAIPADTMATSSQQASISMCSGVEGSMRPQLGDTIINRYVLVSPLCEEQGLQVWKATDQILDQECQLFIILDASAVGEADTAASVIAASNEHRCTPILHIHHEDDALIVVTEPDTGVSLAEYLDGGRFGTLGYDAIRSIIGDTAYTVRHLMDNGVVHHAISADTVRVSTSGVQLADAPVSMMIADSVAYAGSSSAEELAICQLSALLYRLLTHRRYEAASDMEALPEDTPYEFRLICSRGLRIGDEAPLASIPEFMALLNTWVTVPELGDQHLPLPTATGQASIQRLAIRPTDVENLIPMPKLVTSHPATTEPDVTTDGTSAEHQSSAAAVAAATANPVKSLWDKGRTILAEGIDSGHHPTDSGNLFGTQYPTQEPVGNERLTIPLDVSSVRAEPASPFEETSRIPVIDDNGVPVESASARALQAEQSVPDGTVPPSFTPKEVVRAEDLDDADVSDQTIFGRLTTKTMAIIAAVVVLVAALFGTMHILSTNSSDPNVIQTDGEAWPEFDPDAVPFGNDSAAAESDDTEDTADDTAKDENKTDQSEDQPDTDTAEPADEQDADSEDAQDQPAKTHELITADKQASAVPTPRHVNTTPFEIQSESFINAPSANGYGYAVHLAQPQDVYRMVITIRSSGGRGYVKVNTTDPNAGEQVAEFTFAEGDTTEVMFDTMVNTQDILLWVPTEDLPQNQLYIDEIQFF